MRAWLALAAWCAGLAAAGLLDDPRRRFVPFLVAFGIATTAWLTLGRRLATLDRSTVRFAMGLGLITRLAFLILTPAFSEDVFRHIYEGRLAWAMGPGAPFSFPPADAPDLGVTPALLDEAWLRINHPEILTIYPPLAQLMFAAAGALSQLTGLGALIAIKSLIVAADLGTWHAVARALKKRGRPVAESLWYGLCPLVLWEGAREGHADALSALGLAIGTWGFLAARPRRGYIGFALAALAKLNGLVVLPAALRSTLRGSGFALVLLLGLAVPFVLSGSAAGIGLTEYATRWRAGDGVFSLLLSLAEAILGGDWARIGVWTLTRQALARVLTATVFGVFVLVLLARRPETTEVPGRAALMLVVLLLLAPTLHPWYGIWLVPFAAVGAGPRNALLTLIALAPLLHYGSHHELITGVWHDPAWLRALVHGPVWLLLLGPQISARLARKRARAPRGPPRATDRVALR